MPSCYILIGPPACGKSTWCRAMVPQLNDPAIISTDDLIEAKARELNRRYDEMFSILNFGDLEKTLKALMTRAIIDGRDIIVDRTNCSVLDRNKFLKLVPRTYEKVGVIFKFDPDELYQRSDAREKATGKQVPHFVIDRKIKELTLPLPGEFDRIEVC